MRRPLLVVTLPLLILCLLAAATRHHFHSGGPPATGSPAVFEAAGLGNDFRLLASPVSVEFLRGDGTPFCFATLNSTPASPAEPPPGVSIEHATGTPLTADSTLYRRLAAAPEIVHLSTIFHGSRLDAASVFAVPSVGVRMVLIPVGMPNTLCVGLIQGDSMKVLVVEYLLTPQEHWFGRKIGYTGTISIYNARTGLVVITGVYDDGRILGFYTGPGESVAGAWFRAIPILPRRDAASGPGSALTLIFVLEIDRLRSNGTAPADHRTT